MKIFDKRLHSCPMCGSNDIYIEETGVEKIKIVYVGCANCGLLGYKSFFGNVNIDSVIKYWNNRMPVTLSKEEFDAHDTVVGKRIDFLNK